MEFDPKIIEALKVANEQIVQVDAGKSAAKDAVKEQNSVSNLKSEYSEFAEKLVQKLIYIDREKAAVDKELTEVRNAWSELEEKKKRLEGRKEELDRIQDKIMALDKEVSEVKLPKNDEGILFKNLEK